MSKSDFYLIQNMVRSQSSKLQRAMSPARHDVSLWVLGRRVLPKRPLTVSIAEFESNKDLLLKMVKEGRISIVTPDQTVIDSMSDGRLTFAVPGDAVHLQEAAPASKPVEKVEEKVVEAVKVEEEVKVEAVKPVEEAKAEEPTPEQHAEMRKRRR